MSFICTSLETQGQSVGMRESPNYWEKIREEKVGEKVRNSPYSLSTFFSAIFFPVAVIWTDWLWISEEASREYVK